MNFPNDGCKQLALEGAARYVYGFRSESDALVFSDAQPLILAAWQAGRHLESAVTIKVED